jgi:hypothetical protein
VGRARDRRFFLNGDTDLKPGDIVEARVAHADEYDLWAERGVGLPLGVQGTGRKKPAL